MRLHTQHFWVPKVILLSLLYIWQHLGENKHGMGLTDQNHVQSFWVNAGWIYGLVLVILFFKIQQKPGVLRATTFIVIRLQVSCRWVSIVHLLLLITKRQRLNGLFKVMILRNTYLETSVIEITKIYCYLVGLDQGTSCNLQTNHRVNWLSIPEEILLGLICYSANSFKQLHLAKICEIF